jgi:hypothetical protein
MVRSLESGGTLKQLPQRYVELVTEGLTFGSRRVQNTVQTQLRADLVGHDAESKAMEYLASMRDLVRGVEGTHKFSDADLKGRDLRVTLVDGRVVDLDVKASEATQNAAKMERVVFSNRTGVPIGLEGVSNGNGSMRIYRSSSLVVVNPRESEADNRARLRAALEG